MFEKEAEEYAIEHEYEYDDIEVAREALYQAYLAGAEFGYNKSMNEAKGIVKDLLYCLPKENIEGVYEVAEEAEQFLSVVEK